MRIKDKCSLWRLSNVAFAFDQVFIFVVGLVMFGKHIGPVSVSYRIVGLAFGVPAVDGLDEEALGINEFGTDSGPPFPAVRTFHKAPLFLNGYRVNVCSARDQMTGEQVVNRYKYYVIQNGPSGNPRKMLRKRCAKIRVR
jgi:hypothetical protein